MNICYETEALSSTETDIFSSSKVKNCGLLNLYLPLTTSIYKMFCILFTEHNKLCEWRRGGADKHHNLPLFIHRVPCILWKNKHLVNGRGERKKEQAVHYASLHGNWNCLSAGLLALSVVCGITETYSFTKHSSHPHIYFYIANYQKYFFSTEFSHKGWSIPFYCLCYFPSY